jgi:hypothetical protein
MQFLVENHPWSGVAVEALRRSLARVISLTELRASRRLMELLNYLFEETVAGRGGQLSQYKIAFECMGMGPDFDAERNSLVRVHVRRLRLALVAYSTGAGAAEEIRMRLSASGYSLIFERRLTASKPLRQEWPTLGLIEFKTLALEGPWRHLPALLAEELSGVITGAGGLRFMGPFARRVVEAEGIDAVRLGTRHRLDFIIDGSVQGVGESLIIRTRLLDGKTGMQIWAGKDELSLNAPDLAGFEVKLMARLSAEIGGDIGRVSSHLSALARVKPENALSVYEAVLMGRMYLSDFHHESLPQALAALRRAVREMPDEPSPHSTLAVVLATLGAEPAWPGDPPLIEILQLAERAWALDPGDPWSILAMATSSAINRQPAKLAEIGLRVADSPRATPMVQAVVGVLLCFQKVEVAAALRLIERAREENPHYLRAVHLARSLVLLDAGQLAEALSEIEAYQVRWGWADPLIRRAIATRQEDSATARDEWQRVIAAFPDFETDGQRSIGYLWHDDYVRLTCDLTRHPVLPAGASATPAAS